MHVQVSSASRVTFICFTNMTLPAASILPLASTLFSRVLYDSDPKTSHRLLDRPACHLLLTLSHKILLLDGQCLFQDSSQSSAGHEPTTSHLLGRHSSLLGHSVLGGTDPPLPKAHVTTRLERGK